MLKKKKVRNNVNRKLRREETAKNENGMEKSVVQFQIKY